MTLLFKLLIGLSCIGAVVALLLPYRAADKVLQGAWIAYFAGVLVFLFGLAQ